MMWSIVTVGGLVLKLMTLGHGNKFQKVVDDSLEFAKTVEIHGDGKDVWIFDIDETLLLNLPYYTEHGFGTEIFNDIAFNQWVDSAVCLAILESLREPIDRIYVLTNSQRGKKSLAGLESPTSSRIKQPPISFISFFAHPPMDNRSLPSVGLGLY
ncbi:hypothetical protein IFM89_000640 [Coptis chinensis]|uniref:Acid phosphatase n=1 Tax=Coptis chinensis TaxID=261450 RepID=A0A835II20_9MAGN|nr:hypothetical protein IFM89_000640 [Coptis chinensis]